MTVTTTDQQVRELGERWAAAEVSADTAALDALSSDDFALVGPLGFVLDKEQWLQRFRPGQLQVHAVTWDDITVRGYGDAAVAVGRHTQRATFGGQPVNGSFRATHVLVRRDGEWRLAGIHLSPIGGFTPPAGPAR